MKRIYLLTLLGMCAIYTHSQIVTITTKDEQRAKEIVSQMTLEEKLNYIGGYNSFTIRAIPRLGLPDIRMADGPQGLNHVPSTMYPAGILSASTWNRELIYNLGRGIGQDAKCRGVNIMLAPGVNMYRSPLCGRNFEYFGEDPYLASETAKQYILGMQSEGVIATIKHFAGNNQEWDRNNISTDADERTLQEIYFPTFRKAVEKAHVGAVMNSYNLLNGVHATENHWLNIEVLRNQWGFKGILMSDWNSVYSAIGAANGGLDLEMPSGKFMNKENLLPAIQNGTVTEQAIDLKVQHILQTLNAFGLLDRKPDGSHIPKDNPFSCQTALQLAREGVILLKNEGNILPLRKGKTGFCGANVTHIPAGGGSGGGNPIHCTNLWQGMQQICPKDIVLLPGDIEMNHELGQIYTDRSLKETGFTAEYFKNKDFNGKPDLVRVDKKIDNHWNYGAPVNGFPDDNFSVRWTGVFKAVTNGTLRINLEGDDGYRLFIDNQYIAGDWGEHPASMRDTLLQVKKDKEYDIRIEYFEKIGSCMMCASFAMIDDAFLKEKLSKVRNIVLCVGFDSYSEMEGSDRSFALSKAQDEFVNKVLNLHSNVILVINSGGGVDCSRYIDRVKAIVMAWYPGQEGGQAIAEILTGKISPSGKLPVSIETAWKENPVSNSYHQEPASKQLRVQYSEGIFTGYRGYDRSGKKPLFPFGYGLTYTTFSYSNLTTEEWGKYRIRVSFDVKNIGKADAAEIAQVYVHDIKASVPRPAKELKGYEKIFLKKGETRRVVVELDEEAFSFYDVVQHKFTVENGEFEILVGPSSATLPLKATVKL